MNTVASGDAMTARFHREGDSAALKREKLPVPYAWYLHAADTDQFTSQGEHCQQRRWRNPVEVTSHRYFRLGSACHPGRGALLVPSARPGVRGALGYQGRGRVGTLRPVLTLERPRPRPEGRSASGPAATGRLRSCSSRRS